MKQEIGVGGDRLAGELGPAGDDPRGEAGAVAVGAADFSEQRVTSAHDRFRRSTARRDCERSQVAQQRVDLARIGARDAHIVRQRSRGLCGERRLRRLPSEAAENRRTCHRIAKALRSSGDGILVLVAGVGERENLLFGHALEQPEPKHGERHAKSQAGRESSGP